MRGKERGATSPKHFQGITPARAGKSAGRDCAIHRYQDHPRACGEKQPGRPVDPAHGGSPPRVRGKVPKPFHQLLRQGITPARAGKRKRNANAWHNARDHPRACGEKISSQRAMITSQGSPPRVRGKVVVKATGGHSEGITPARAGKSLEFGNFLAVIQDHPRACGEKLCGQNLNRTTLGSPPRVRGKDRHRRADADTSGITPARAGKREAVPSSAVFGKDHPRACGEKHRIITAWFADPGSPPRVRGKGSASAPSAPLPGITPARAGKSRRVPVQL